MTRSITHHTVAAVALGVAVVATQPPACATMTTRASATPTAERPPARGADMAAARPLASAASPFARSAAFSALYSCTVPLLGTRPVTIVGTLTAAPARPVAGQVVHFQLHISGLSLWSPVAIESWSATAVIEVGGAQTGSFRLAGAGGPVAPRQPVSGDLAGDWTPRVHGTDRLRGGNVVIKGRISRLGNATVPCTPSGAHPHLGTLLVGRG
jgi:hypothetical protein